MLPATAFAAMAAVPSVLVRLETDSLPIWNMPFSMVGIGALTVVGQCLGAGEKVQAKRYSRLLLLTAYAGDWVMNLSGLFFLNKLALSWFNLSPEAQTMALQVMVWFNFVSLFFWPSSFTLPNILRAAGDARFTICDGAGLPRPSALHLDGHVPGLGVPLAVLLRALCTGPVDGTERHLTPCVFQAVCTLCGVRAVFLFLPCARKRRAGSYCSQKVLLGANFTQILQINRSFFDKVVTFPSCFRNNVGV